ncbi:MAG: 30S ribosomal protein S3 [Chloroflexi bacterium]|nr:30S ribosomal protein S3 [Chloroflexota bacterium]
MGHKVHPHGFRLGYIYDWSSKWYADKTYTELLHEDLSIRRAIRGELPDAGIAKVEIERNANQITVTINTARPGIVIGRGGQRVDELRGILERVSGRRVRVNITEVRLPEIEAPLVARAIAEQIERRVAHRRAIKQAAMRAMQRGAQGIRIRVAGRLGGADMSRQDQERQGRVPLHTMKADIDYGTSEAATTLGRIGVKVWIYKGDIIPEREAPPMSAADRERQTAERASKPDKSAGERREAVVETEASTTEKGEVVVETEASTTEKAEVVVETEASTTEKPEVVVKTEASTSEKAEVVVEQPGPEAKAPEVEKQEPPAEHADSDASA